MPGLDMSTIVFAIIAIFVVWKLRSVLGTRNGAERPPIDPGVGPNLGSNGAGAPKPMGQVVRLPTAPRDGVGPANFAPADASARWKGFAEPGSKLADGRRHGDDPKVSLLTRITRVDSFASQSRGGWRAN